MGFFKADRIVIPPSAPAPVPATIPAEQPPVVVVQQQPAGSFMRRRCARDHHQRHALGQRRRFVFDVPAGFAGAPVLYARGYYQPFAARAAR